MDAYKDAILAYALYYPAVDFFSAIAIACVIWYGGQDVMRAIVSKSVSIQFDPQHLISFHFVATAASLGVLIAFTQQYRTPRAFAARATVPARESPIRHLAR